MKRIVTDYGEQQILNAYRAAGWQALAICLIKVNFTPTPGIKKTDLPADWEADYPGYARGIVGASALAVTYPDGSTSMTAIDTLFFGPEDEHQGQYIYGYMLLDTDMVQIVKFDQRVFLAGMEKITVRPVIALTQLP